MDETERAIETAKIVMDYIKSRIGYKGHKDENK